MFKKNFNFRNYIFFALTLLFSPFVALHAKANVKHDPNQLFEKTENSKTAVRFAHSTKASELHKLGYKGKNTKVAIIENYFHVRDTAPLIKKGVIDQEALKKGFIIHPDEKLEELDNNKIDNDIDKKRAALNNSQSINEKTKLQEEVKQLDTLSHRKFIFDLYSKDKTVHGSQVMDALHQIAPEATLFPISTSIRLGDMNLSIDERIGQGLTNAIHTAIQHNVNIINFSDSLKYLNNEGIGALKEAQKKGIAIICSSGNDSGVDPSFFQRIFDKAKNIFVKSNKMKVFDALDKKGMLFSGALHYDKEGNEKVADFTSIPKAETLSNFIMAPGDDLYLTSELVSGTSFSAPITVGGYLLLKQYAEENKLSYKSPDDLLRILHDSGHTLEHSPWHGFTTDSYKVLNLKNAIELANQRLKPALLKSIISPQISPKKALVKEGILLPTQQPKAVSSVKTISNTPALEKTAVLTNQNLKPAVLKPISSPQILPKKAPVKAGVFVPTQQSKAISSVKTIASIPVLKKTAVLTNQNLKPAALKSISSPQILPKKAPVKEGVFVPTQQPKAISPVKTKRDMIIKAKAKQLAAKKARIAKAKAKQLSAKMERKTKKTKVLKSTSRKKKQM